MSFIKYLKETVRFIVFYFILMCFIIFTIYFDRKNRVLDSDISYIILVSLIMFIIYIITDYLIKLCYVKKLLQTQNSADKTPILPAPLDYKDEVYSSLIGDLYGNYVESIKNIENDFKENKEFMTAWVHEIKTPITTSKLLIQSENISESLQEEIDRIDDYVEKVLYYSRSDSFSEDYILSEVNINKIIRESVKKHSVLFIKKHIKFIDEVPEAFTVDTDKKWILFIIDQLISNALKYTGHNGSITFKSFEDDKEQVLAIEDNGAGIKSEDLNRIFSKAFTGYNGRNENIKATGFGLYLSQKLAKKLNHYITIESEYGKGTTAFIHFPKWNDYYNVTRM